jgi:hypothetical protein
MNKKIFENARFCPKGDIEANWNRAVGFVPLDKEIIIYKADEEHPVARFKVGDGKTLVQNLPFAGADDREIKAYIDSKIEAIPQADYNQNDETAIDYIKNRPFYEYDKVITWDGSTDGRDSLVLDEGMIFYKVSDDIFDFTENTPYTLNANGEIVEYTDSYAEEIEGMYSGLFVKVSYMPIAVVVKDKDAFTADTGLEVTSNGLYFIRYDNGENVFYTSSIKLGFIIKKLDEKFIPDTIARVEPILSAIEDKVITATKDNILSIFN